MLFWVLSTNRPGVYFPGLQLPLKWKERMTRSTDKPLLSAATGGRPRRHPVWFLRQAGRYLPEYREIRKSMTFLELCRDPARASEVTLQPLKRFDLDAAIIFSDILIPPAHMGQTLTFDKGHGPMLSNPVRSAAALKKLQLPNWEKDAGYTGEAIAKTKSSLNPSQTMIGFAGAPFTVASYMIEGGSSKTFSEVKKLMFSQPEVFGELMSMLVETTKDYLSMQVRAGAEALMLFDTWAGNLAAGDYKRYVFPHMESLLKSVKSLGVPLTGFPGQGGEVLYDAAGLDFDVLAVDWRVPLNRAEAILSDLGSPCKCLQGNLDPLVLSQNDEGFVRERVRSVLESAPKTRAHIFNVGHGVLPTTSPEAITQAIDELRSFKGSSQVH